LERVSNKHDENLPAATLYLDDVVEIVDTFSKACERLEISSGEYKTTDPSELSALAGKFPSGRFDDLKIQGFKPFVSLELRAYGARTYISEDTLEQRVVITHAREVLQRCRKIKPGTLENIAFFSLVALSSAAFIAKFYIAFACLALAWVLMLLFGTRFRMKYTVVVYTKSRSEAKTFWQRKKDDVLLAVISAAIGAAASYAATKLLP
jgi:hypothetical protein